MNKKVVGDIGEKIAKKLLERRGYLVLETNFHTRFGELDIIAQEEETLVFVEVKTRHSRIFGLPEESVGKRKLKHIERAGQIYRAKHQGLPEAERIDIVAIDLDQNNKPTRKELIKNVSFYE